MTIKDKFKKRNKKSYMMVKRNGLNVLVETPESKERSEKFRSSLNLFFTIISTLAAIIAAIFAALTYINS